MPVPTWNCDHQNHEEKVIDDANNDDSNNKNNASQSQETMQIAMPSRSGMKHQSKGEALPIDSVPYLKQISIGNTSGVKGKRTLA